MDGYLIVLALLAAYLLVVVLGKFMGIWKKLNVSLYGPLLLWRTRRGRKWMERAASRKRIWKAYGAIAIWACIMAMFVLMLFLLWESYRVLTVPVSPESADIRLGQLGAGTAMLAVYFVFGLTVAVAVHEYFHGILIYAEKIRLEFVGLVFLVIPLGAFVEPKDEDLKAAKESGRMRVFASGPATNILVALVCLGVLTGVLGPSIEPSQEGALVIEVAHDSPADVFGLSIWSEITWIGGTPIRKSSDLTSFEFDNPGDYVRVYSTRSGREASSLIPGGIVVTSVYEGPAFNVGIRPGMIIASLDDTAIHTQDELRSVTENSTHDGPVNITLLKYVQDPVTGDKSFAEDETIRQINLTSKWVYYYRYYPKSYNREEFRNQSTMGVGVSPLGVRYEEMDYLPKLVTHPLGADQGGQSLAVRLVRFISLPTLGYSPVVSPATDLYEPSGVFAGVPSDIYWVLVNVFYWLFWANFLLGIANTIPAIPLDGGFVLRDALKELVHRRAIRINGLDRALGKKPLADWQIDQVMWIISALVYLMLVIVLTWQFVGPVF